MLKPLTMSLGLAVALGLCGVTKAGHGNNSGCTTCGLASPQGVVASPQGNYTSCEKPCKPKRESCLKNLFHHQVTYEWVLKKKHCFHRGGSNQCSTCGTGAVYPTSQVAPSGQYAAPSGQYAAPSGQYAAPQAHGTMQKSAFLPYRATTSIASVPAEMTPAAPSGEDVPPAPAVGGLLLPSGR